MGRTPSWLLVVMGRFTGQLKDLGGEVLHDSGQIDRGTQHGWHRFPYGGDGEYVQQGTGELRLINLHWDGDRVYQAGTETSVANVFATAAMRFGHQEVCGVSKIKLVKKAKPAIKNW